MSDYFCYDSETKLETLIKGHNYRKIKSYDENTMVVEVYFEDGGEGTPHTHPHIQISYCLEGEFEYSVGDEAKIIKEGDSVYVPSGIIHGCKLLSKKGRLLDVFSPMRKDFIEK